MKKIIFPIIIGMLVFSVGYSFYAMAEENLVPSWIKNTAKFWVDGQVSDQEFINAMKFLIQSGVIDISEKDTTAPTVSTKSMYTNDLFGFSLEPPPNWIQYDNAETVNPGEAGIVSFDAEHFNYGDCDYNTNFIIHYVKDEPLGGLSGSDLLDAYEFVIYFEESSQTRLIEKSISSFNNDYKLTYTFNDVSYFPADEDCPEEYIPLQNEFVIFVDQNGNTYNFIFSSEPQFFDETISEFRKAVGTFSRI